jgi:AcrR family transcriptional regulator
VVLDAAMRAFWVAGFEATSTEQLCAATGLQRGSLYNAFTGKHDLLVAVLERYMAQRAGEIRSTRSLERLAQYVIATISGLRVAAEGGFPALAAAGAPARRRSARRVLSARAASKPGGGRGRRRHPPADGAGHASGRPSGTEPERVREHSAQVLGGATARGCQHHLSIANY